MRPLNGATMNLSDIFREETVLDDLQSTEKNAVIAEMVEILRRIKAVPANRAEDILRAIVRSEVSR